MSESKARVLFVDDEVNLLMGLRRMLYGKRNEWDMTFVESGAKAIEAFATTPFDVIVSDMRMPEMDGARLLSHIRDHYPGTVRIVLSGYAENETVLRTLGPSHQYLAKPCEAGVLIQTIESALRLRRFVCDPPLRQFVAGLQNVPSPSEAYRSLMAELENPATTPARVGDVIAHDASLAVQTLKLTNSAYFALPTKVTSCRQAVQMLGFDVIRSVVTIANFYSEFSGNPAREHLLDTLAKRSFAIAALARGIANAEGLEHREADKAFCAGLLAHIGTLVIIANLPDRFEKAMELADNDEISIIDAESQVIGATHAEVGAYLLGLWGFDMDVIEAVRVHHGIGATASATFGISSIVHAAQYLTWECGHPTSIAPCARLDRAHFEYCGKADRIDAWRDMCRATCLQEAAAS